MSKYVFLLVAALLTGGSASAQSITSGDNPSGNGLYATIGGGGTKADRDKGGAVTLGAAVKAGPIFASVTAADWILASADTYPYFRDYYWTGASACRHAETGEYAEDTKCNKLSTTYAWSADVQAFIPGTPIAVGGGRRFGRDDKDLWFGSVGGYWQSPTRRYNITAKVNLGDSYLSGLVTLGVRVTR